MRAPVTPGHQRVTAERTSKALANTNDFHFVLNFIPLFLSPPRASRLAHKLSFEYVCVETFFETVCELASACVCAGSQWGLYFGRSSLTDNSPPCSSHLLLRGREIDRL